MLEMLTTIHGTGILEKRRERAARREAIHRRNVLGLLPEKKPKPPKRLGKKAMRRKRKEERAVRGRTETID